MARQAVILAGGRGTRLGALARDRPKPLLEISGRPFIAHLIENVARFGFTDIVLLVGPFEAAFREALGNGERLGVRLTLIPEPNPAGTGGALAYAVDRLRPRFLMLNGDSFFDFNILDLAAPRRLGDWLARIALLRVADTGRYGRVTLAGGRVGAFAEKAGSGPGLINGGVYWLKRDILDCLGKGPASLETDILPRLVARGLVQGRAYDGRFIDIGIPADLERARRVLARWRRRPAVFFDRDGVLNRDDGYVHRPEDFHWLPGAKRAIREVNDSGWYAFVVTNQAGIARGYYDVETLHRLHRWVNSDLARMGAHVDAFYHCPHHPTAGTGPLTRECDCRKPAPGMILQAMAEWPIDARHSVLVGDTDEDMEAARRAGIAGHKLAGGDDLADCVHAILNG